MSVFVDVESITNYCDIIFALRLFEETEVSCKVIHLFVFLFHDIREPTSTLSSFPSS